MSSATSADPMYAVEIAPAARRDLKKIPTDARRRIFRALVSLGENPRPAGVRKLTDTGNLYRVRVGSHRVIYKVRDDVLVVLVLRARHRSRAYR